MKYSKIVDKKIKFSIHLFITKNLKFRVRIEKEDRKGYEVTIGGKNWKNGMGNEYKDIINDMIDKIVFRLESEWEKL